MAMATRMPLPPSEAKVGYLPCRRSSKTDIGSSSVVVVQVNVDTVETGWQALASAEHFL